MLSKKSLSILPLLLLLPFYIGCAKLKRLNPTIHCVETRAALKLDLRKITYIRARIDSCDEKLIQLIEVEEKTFNFTPFLKNKYASADFKLPPQLIDFVKAKILLSPKNFKVAAAPLFNKNFHTLLIIRSIEQMLGKKIHILTKEQEAKEYYVAYLATLEAGPPQGIWYLDYDKNIILSRDGNSVESYNSSLTPRKMRDEILQWKGARGNSPYPIGPYISKKAIQTSTNMALKETTPEERKIISSQKLMGIGPFHKIIPLHNQMPNSPYSLYQLEQLARTRISRDSKEKFKDFDVESLLLILGFMRTFHLKSIHPLNIDVRQGILFHSSLW